MRLFGLLLLLISAGLRAQTEESFVLHSFFVKDSFHITIKKPAGYDNKKLYNLVFVADGNLKLGNYVLGKEKSWAASIPEDCIIIAISHFGNWHTKRARDFIPSDEGGYADENFGQAKSFYCFMKNELVMRINRKFPNQKSKSFIGHSFSGLFCLYTLFQKDKLFDHHFAISPSVWANDEELLKTESVYDAKHDTLRADVYIQAGGLEFLNKVLSSTKMFLTNTSSHHYEFMQVGFSTVKNANHFSIIKPAVDKIFERLKD